MTCLYCAGPLVSVWHWGVCPSCSATWLATVTMPTIAQQVSDRVGGLMLDKGRPYRDGKPQ